MARNYPLPVGSGRVSSFFFLGASVLWLSMAICPSTCPVGWRGMTRSLLVVAIGRFSGDQTALLNQLLHQFGYKSVSY